MLIRFLIITGLIGITESRQLLFLFLLVRNRLVSLIGVLSLVSCVLWVRLLGRLNGRGEFDDLNWLTFEIDYVIFFSLLRYAVALSHLQISIYLINYKT